MKTQLPKQSICYRRRNLFAHRRPRRCIRRTSYQSRNYSKDEKAAKIPVQVGGGIRSMAQVDYYLESGIDRVIIGSAALTDPDFLRAAVQNTELKL